MNWKLASLYVLTFLLTSTVVTSLKVQRVEAVGIIYIRADGSIDPPTAPIQHVEDYYTFTANIYDSITIERDNIIVDGAEYTVQGAASGSGIYLEGRSKVTIKNMRIAAFSYGICLESSCSNNSISGNEITNSWAGILLSFSSGNSVNGNNITEVNYYGIYLYSSSNNSISGNSITDNYYGIYFHSSSDNNSISKNKIANNSPCGIELDHSSDNVFHHNNLDNKQQVRIFMSAGNIWNYGYPFGGNYWSDYNGTDNHSGPYQDVAGSDGIGDTPYVIDANNTDHYPLMTQYQIPEFPSFLILPLFMIATLLAIIVYKKQHTCLKQ